MAQLSTSRSRARLFTAAPQRRLRRCFHSMRLQQPPPSAPLAVAACGGVFQQCGLRTAAHCATKPGSRSTTSGCRRSRRRSGACRHLVTLPPPHLHGCSCAMQSGLPARCDSCVEAPRDDACRQRALSIGPHRVTRFRRGDNRSVDRGSLPSRFRASTLAHAECSNQDDSAMSIRPALMSGMARAP